MCFKKKCLILILISFVLVFMSFYTPKKDINCATYSELEQIQDIGEKLANDIVYYCKENKPHSVKELKGKIKYMGDKRIEELAKIYK